MVFFLTISIVNENSPQSLIPLWKNNIRMNLYVFINSEARFNDYQATPSWKVTIINQQQEYNLLNHLLIPVSPGYANFIFI